MSSSRSTTASSAAAPAAGPSRPSSSTSSSAAPLHFFPTPALDHAFSGITAGAVATVCMNPLDLIKVKFQVDTGRPGSRLAAGTSSRSSLRTLAYYASGGKVVRDVGDALRDIVRQDGWKGLYRGLSPNVVGNSASWGLYFLWYTMIKEYMASDGSTDGKGKAKQLSPAQHLLAASESGAVTALMTNPIWVVKTRMFATRAAAEAAPSSLGTAAAAASTATSGAGPGATSTAAAAPAQPHVAYRGLMHGLSHIWATEGIRGLYRGAGLALVGVSNGAIQFVAYEELKRWRSGLARRREGGLGGGEDDGRAVKLSNTEYIIMSGVAKLAAIGLTYPYQVVRSRIQNHTTAHLYPNIPTCIRLTYRHEGLRGFYKGMATSAIRILPGTCVTFVVYENTSWALREAAERREKKRALVEDGAETRSLTA